MTSDAFVNFAVSKNRLEHVVGAMAEALIVVDGQRIIRQVNPAVCKLFGYSVNELIGRSFTMLLPDRANSWFDGFEFLPEENLAKGIETACQAKNGRTISAIISGSVIRNETGKVQETILLLQDVTVRNRMIEALAESEERLRSTLASISDLIFVLNRENVFVEYYSTDAADGKFPPFYAVIGRSIADIFSESVVRQMEMAIASNGISKARSLAELMKTLTGGTGSP